MDDVWMVTHQEAIDWIKYPVKNDEAHGLSQCKSRIFNVDCVMIANDTAPMPPFANVLTTKYLWLYQSLFLVISYLVVVKYDRFKQKQKKK